MRTLLTALFGISIGMTTLAAMPAAAQTTSTSPACGPVAGESSTDRANVVKFCESVPADIAVGAYATDMLLYIKVPRNIANALRADHLTTEQLIKTWMRGWRQITDKNAVSIYVEWGDVEIAKGETTILHGDKVAIK